MLLMAIDKDEDPTCALLERLGANMPTIIFDRARLTDAGVDEINQIRAAYRDEMTIMPLAFERLQEMFIFAPPDQLERYKAGFPIVIAPVHREDQGKNPAHRPTDTAIVQKAKNALEIEIYRLTGRQVAVEREGSSRMRDLTLSGAVDRAKAMIARAAWRGGNDPDDELKKGRLEGLIDRGRRLAAKFFGTRNPMDVWHGEARDVQERVAATGRAALPIIESDNRDRAAGMACNQERARTFNNTVRNWNSTARTGEPITLADGIQITNSIQNRMTAQALMKVAIEGDFDPTSVHMNVQLERNRFELGMQLGRLSRGRSIELSLEHASILKRAISTVQRKQCETHADACDWLLVDAAARSHLLPFWEAVTSRVLASGTSETINPENCPVAEKSS